MSVRFAAILFCILHSAFCIPGLEETMTVASHDEHQIRQPFE